MKTLDLFKRRLAEEGEEKPVFVVVHPLDDEPEEKIDTSSLGPLPMTRTVRYSLMALRSYLIFMMGLVGLHVLRVSGLLHHITR